MALGAYNSDACNIVEVLTDTRRDTINLLYGSFPTS
jgi:hypothetical protein